MTKDKKNFKNPLISVFWAIKPFQSQYEKTIKEKTKTLLQRSVILNDTDIIDTHGHIDKKIPEDDYHFRPHLSLIISPTTFEKYNGFEGENLQLQTVYETYLSVTKQSLNVSYFILSFLENESKFKDFSAPPCTPLNSEEVLKYQKTGLALNIV